MNNEHQPCATTTGYTLIRQAIVDRRHALWGSEIRAEHHGEDALPESAWREAMLRINPRRKTLQVTGQGVRHAFLRIGQAALMNEDTFKAIIQTAQSLEKHRQPLTLTLDNRLDALPGPVERRAMVRQLYKLKDHSGITLAYNNYRLDTKPGDLLIDLKLYDYIKMPFPDSALRLSLNTRSDLFDRLYDRMLALISASGVRFIADTVEFADSAMLAKNLPFEYFQGGYYSPADCL
ncbi:hypothetical protein C9382_24115 [Pseudomonas aylmerensis]|uniref:EAL domain-containing protein n=1 Tax=Pseudomonas aylmerensis TaxID=1869229 RepID=A0A2T4FPW0_9PSED|nr:hypothetical protein [Pseudomonas aylmerensis]AYF48359.1 hypothetical protein DXV65_12450 [Pseudomonas fluorescens]OCW24142.1 hypothetical protein BBG20_19715 [Pseudomonas aylmerensis]PTC25454.1 hypothetical protein C9382_24115 [Pseudomonas aylmerensis]QTV17570.1 hypothetical protein J9321_01170 [Pseudomonas fluorescens]